MLPKQSIQEELSFAYMKAVTAFSGALFEKVENDFGVDGTIKSIKKIDGRIYEEGYGIDVQLKSTINWEKKDGYIIYDFEVKNYNDLIRRVEAKSANKFILVLLCLPESQEEWLSIDINKLILKHCCYWYCPVESQLSRQTTIRIRIPLSNIVNKDTIISLLTKVKTGEEII